MHCHPPTMVEGKSKMEALCAHCSRMQTVEDTLSTETPAA